ncbi:MAG: DUF4105 domain-containing protein [Paludibacteraceae bacterium]|nr:DUF4105 domain-containing protein [Paludibacteraceae bacterium]
MKSSRTYRLICTLLMLAGLLLSPTARADEQPQLLSDSAKIYLLTCSPGEALYERYGHTAILVLDDELGISEVYNYGIFDFSTEHFYWRFVKGETYYQLGKEDASWFMRLYAYAGRQVNIQQLNLTPADRDAIYRALIINYYPENRVYLYNFVFDNCATRPYYLLMNALGEKSEVRCQNSDITFRQIIRHYTPQGSWGDFGINLVFGPKADKLITDEQRLFLPEQLMNHISSLRYADGTPLVAAEHIEPFVIQRVPWYATWYFGLAVLFVVLAIISLHDRRQGKRTKWVDYVLYAIYGALLVLVAFLTFFSIHPLVGFGPYLLIIPSIHLCARIIYLWR